jgi:hypothetical protein
MSDTAVWLTERVLPTVQIRQWVCTLPWGLRVVAGYDRQSCALLVDSFVRELQRSYRWRAKREFGLSSVNEAFTGTVTVIQRFDSALRLNVHMHTLVLDGVYVKCAEGEGLRFLRLPRPTEHEVYEVALRMAKRVAVILEKMGRPLDGSSSGGVRNEIDAALGACYDIAGKAPRVRVVDDPRMGKGECAVVVDDLPWSMDAHRCGMRRRSNGHVVAVRAHRSRQCRSEWVDEEVVCDNGLVTSRKAEDIPAFSRKLVEEISEGLHGEARRLAERRETVGPV